MDAATKRALEAITSDAKAAKVARALPPGKRPRAFMISIGMSPDDIVGPSDDKATMIEAVPEDDEDDEDEG